MNRATLPQRRPHEAFDFTHWGRRFTAGIGRPYQNGPIREVWINTGRSGEQMETLARDAAVLLSLALQYGTPLEAMRKAIMRDLDGKPSGPIGQLIEKLCMGEAGGPGQPLLPDDPSPGPTHPQPHSPAGELADVV